MIRQSEFRPAWWLPGPHLQTLWPVLFRKRPRLNVRGERLELADGDFLDLARIGNNDGPTVLVLHGLEGSLHSHYAGSLLDRLDRAGFCPVFMHFRGCSGTPNRLARSYHSGETGDLHQVLSHLRAVTGSPVAAAVGFSLGGNVLLKWLGEQGNQAPLQAAVAVSVPFQLGDAADRLNRGLSRLYRWYLLRSLREHYQRKFRRMKSPLKVDVSQLRDFWGYDDKVTAPLHGFSNVDDYYDRCSSRPFLARIRTPTLILHALDDPFMFPNSIPEDIELAAPVTLELSQRGGHVGFVANAGRKGNSYWIEERICSFLSARLGSTP